MATALDVILETTVENNEYSVLEIKPAVVVPTDAYGIFNVCTPAAVTNTGAVPATPVLKLCVAEVDPLKVEIPDPAMAENEAATEFDKLVTALSKFVNVDETENTVDETDAIVEATVVRLAPLTGV